MDEIAPLQKEPVWSNERNYYDHIRALWEDVRLSRRKLNDSPHTNIIDGFKALEDWFETQKAIIDKIAPFIDKDVLQTLDANRDFVHELTQHRRFADLGMQADGTMWTDIKQKLEDNERIISFEFASLGLYMRRKSKKNMDEYLV